MAVTLDQVEDFAQFARRKLGNGGAASLEQLLVDWRAAREREETNAALRVAIKEMEAGECIPLDDVIEELRIEFGYPRK